MRGAVMMASQKRVRQLNGNERQWVIDGHIRDTLRTEIRRLLCKRLKIWAKTVGSGGAAALIFVQWGTDFADALAKFGAALSNALQALGLK